MTPRLALLILAALIAVTLVLVVSQTPTSEREEPLQVHSVGWDHPTDSQSWEAPTTTTSTTSTTVVRYEVPRPHTTAPTKPLAVGAMEISSTQYCEHGTMANGRYVHDGAVSSHVLARGSSWRVLDGELAGRVFTVEDTGPAATFDVWVDSCSAAIAYGRHTIHIEAA